MALADVSHLAGQNHHYHPGSGYQQPTYDYPAPTNDVVNGAPDIDSFTGQRVINSYIPPPSGPVVPPSVHDEPPLPPYQTTSTQAGSQYNYNHQSSSGSSGFTSSHQQSQSSSSGASRQYDTPQTLEPIITKHFYVHAAPEDPEERQGPRYVTVGRPQKNYKIIFIKAPTYGLNSQIIPVLPQNEDKTIVYVLSKKPEFNENIELPPIPTTEPPKPEVYFIKYKTQEEAQQAQEKIQGEFASIGGFGSLT